MIHPTLDIICSFGLFILERLCEVWKRLEEGQYGILFWYFSNFLNGVFGVFHAKTKYLECQLWTSETSFAKQTSKLN